MNLLVRVAKDLSKSCRSTISTCHHQSQLLLLIGFFLFLLYQSATTLSIVILCTTSNIGNWQPCPGLDECKKRTPTRIITMRYLFNFWLQSTVDLDKEWMLRGIVFPSRTMGLKNSPSRRSNTTIWISFERNSTEDFSIHQNHPFKTNKI